MEGQADRKVAAIRLGAPVQFRDRWQGKVAAIEVDEEWEVLNVVVKRGLLRWSTSVKLPFSASPQWSDDRVTLDCTSRQAFAREIPPIAAPARPISLKTPVSLPGARMAGLLVEPGRRLATDVIIRQGGAKKRVPVEDVSFEGKALRIATHGENLRLYQTDDELENQARDALAATRELTGEERRSVGVEVSGGVVIVRGNVLTKNTKRALQHAMSHLAGVATVRVEVVDDLELELAIGQALESAGFHGANVYARSVLGYVTLFGYALNPGVVEDVLRVVSRVPGVRSVESRIEVSAPAAATPSAA
jgi:osmotically-inducible protein OsmY